MPPAHESRQTVDLSVQVKSEYERRRTSSHKIGLKRLLSEIFRKLITEDFEQSSKILRSTRAAHV
jgi:hypothetical protein